MRAIATLAFALLLILPAAGQSTRVITDDGWCDEGRWGDRDTERYCEVREITITDGRDLVDVDGMQNGGVSVRGWDRDEILVRARVTANARTLSSARELAAEVSIETGRTIRADLPRTSGNWRGNREWTSVSYEIFAPRNSNVDLNTHNGGVSIENIDGDVRFDVLNGGVTLVNLAGRVEGETTNGGLSIELTGRSWDGDGMDVATTNGGIELFVPENYSADLETGTVNGRLEFDFPVTVSGRLDRKISTKLGDGGKMIRARTTNGSVKVQRS